MVASQGDLFWVDLGEPSGSRPGFRRPFVVVQNDLFNRSRLSTVIVCALTSNLRRAEAPGNVLLPQGAGNLPQDSVANVTQLFTIDKGELTDRIGRTRGSSQVDPDLQEAAGLLQYSGTKWVFDFSTSLAPTATSEAQYRKAKRALVAYNARLGAKEAVFDPRADNLLATLDRMASDLGSASAVLDRRIAEGSGLIDTEADNVFYTIKGQTYAYYLLLRELEIDFDAVVRDRDLTASWQQLLASMASAAQLNAWVITNGDPGSLIVPNHLAEQGFYLLRARTQLREITNILLK